MNWSALVMLLLMMIVPRALRPQRPAPKGSAQQNPLTVPVSIPGASQLSANSAFEQVMLGSGVPGGEVIVEGCAERPQVPVAPRGHTLREALDSITKADPRFRWEIKRGVIDLVSASSGVPALLRTRIDAFDSGNAPDIASAGSALFTLPEVQNATDKLGLTHNGAGTGLYAIAPRSPHVPKPLDVHLRETTLMDALNAIVQANRHGVWLYRETHCGTENVFDFNFMQ